MNKKNKTLLLQAGLFIATLVFTTFAGGEWMGNSIWEPTYNLDDFIAGFQYSIPFILILTVHEFGHYFTARYHNVKVTLPYYIPFWFLGFLPAIGTMGAFISIKQRRLTLKQYFDIGVSGPLAGFIIALGVLYYGYTHLPERDYIYEIHPEYEYFGEDFEKYVYGYDTFFTKTDYEQHLSKLAPEYWPDTMWFGSEFNDFKLGNNMLMSAYAEYVAPKEELVPNPREMMHYPWLFAGYLALFFTALNLLPIGQLDGGHVIFGLFGSKIHGIIARSLFLGFVFYAGLGLITPYDSTEELVINIPLYVVGLTYIFYSMSPKLQTRILLALAVFTAQFLLSMFYPLLEGYFGWLLFSFLIGRFIGVSHPPAVDEEPLSPGRQIIGWLALLVFVLCFTPQPFQTG